MHMNYVFLKSKNLQKGIYIFVFDLYTLSVVILMQFCSRFDSGHGIIIEGIFPKDFACDVVPWTSDERLKIMMDGVFPEGYRLETDIYYIKGSKAASSLDRSPILTENITLKAMLQIRDVNVDYHYKGAVRLDNAWKFYEAQVCCSLEVKKYP